MPSADPSPAPTGQKFARRFGARALPKLTLWAGLAIACAGVAAANAFSRSHALLINASPSLPYWAIWLDSTRTPGRGDLILFDPPRSELLVRHFGAKPLPFGKRVYGVAGDVVTENNRSFFVNGQKVALAKPVTLRGETLEPGPTGVIPKGCYFAGSPHKDGFDSRYAAIGWVCGKQVLGTGRPVL